MVLIVGYVHPVDDCSSVYSTETHIYPHVFLHRVQFPKCIMNLLLQFKLCKMVYTVPVYSLLKLQVDMVCRQHKLLDSLRH